MQNPTDNCTARFFQGQPGKSHEPQRIELKLCGFSEAKLIQPNSVMRPTYPFPQFAPMLECETDKLAIH